MKILDELGCQNLVDNMGGGLGGKENPELVSAYVDIFHKEIKRMVQKEIESKTERRKCRG